MTQLEHKLSARDIRESVGHPLVDGDGHLIEVKEAFVRFVRSRGREHLLQDPGARGLLVPGEEQVRFPTAERRRQLHLHKPHRWFTPAQTQDYAAVSMPGLMYQRLPDTGFDFSVLFPTLRSTWGTSPVMRLAAACAGCTTR